MSPVYQKTKEILKTKREDEGDKSMLWVYIPVYSQRPYRSTVRDTCYEQGSVGIMVNFPRCCRCSKIA